ncbi:unnamed protein product [Adineta ricciae]|uniref:TGF-beta family profile domain-containing protein n=2 Tax=Adineta ricciae TaxID=249248 RepID=A0A813N430_ADIRI|nr:unnamed protein product [Adineta ricciae]
MFRVTLIIGIFCSISYTFANQSETIVDLYNRIAQSGSLLKAISFDINTQSKLKNINTVRTVSYQLTNNQRWLGVRIKKNPNEQIALIELRCNVSNIHVRLGKYGYHRKYRLPLISNSTQSYDLTHFLHTYHQRMIYLTFPNEIESQTLSVFYYTKSNKNLFSFSSTQHLKRRYRRTILPTNPAMTCAKHEYEIDFNQFSFGKWIVQPKRFNAYTCAGSCPNPLSPRYYPSNHAILLSLMRSQRQYGQQPSCVPVRLKPLCLLYYDRDELIIKYHRDMIVQECGCR